MPKSKFEKVRSKRSISELIEWFEKNDTADYLALMPEVEFDINIKRRRHLVELDPELAADVSKVAKAKKVSSSSLINSWVKEKVSKSKALAR